MKLEANVGMLDVIVRVTLGLALIMLTAVGEIGAWGVVGLALIVTGAARFCPLWALMGISTMPPARHRR